MTDIEKNGVVQETETSQPTQQPINLDDLEDFRKYKSTRDKREAELRRQLETQQQQLSQLSQQMENLVQDPTARAKLREDRMQAELERYRAQDLMNRQRRLMAERWNVPESVLAEAEDGPSMTEAALDYLRDRATQPVPTKTPVVEQPKQEDLEPGADDVSVAPGTPPTVQRLTETEIDEQIASLRQIAQKGGARASQARVEILKLEVQKARPSRRKTRV